MFSWVINFTSLGLSFQPPTGSTTVLPVIGLSLAQIIIHYESTGLHSVNTPSMFHDIRSRKITIKNAEKQKGQENEFHFFY